MGDWNFYKADGTFIGSGDINGVGVFDEDNLLTKFEGSIEAEGNLSWTEEIGFAKPNPESEFGKSFADEKRYIHKYQCQCDTCKKYKEKS